MLCGMASWMRITIASIARHHRKISAYTMYMMPIFL